MTGNQPRDDESFWLNAGVDYAYRRWQNPSVIVLRDIYALGQAMAETGPGAADSIAVDMESRYSDLRLQ